MDNFFWFITADIDAETYGEKQTPLHYAAKNNAVDALKTLLRHGANINGRDYKNRTPIFIATETGITEDIDLTLVRLMPGFH